MSFPFRHPRELWSWSARHATSALTVTAFLGTAAACGDSGKASEDKAAIARSCTTDFKSIEISAEAFYAKTGAFPTSNADLLSSTNKGGLLKVYPTSSDYTLTYAGRNDGYTVTVSGSGLTPGTTSAACDQ